MPNGNHTPIISIGTLPLSPIVSLTNVLRVPSYKVDLMLVSRVTRDLNCSVILFPFRCILKDLMMRTTIGLGKQQSGLYYLVVMTSNKSHTPIPSLTSHDTKSSLLQTLLLPCGIDD